MYVSTRNILGGGALIAVTILSWLWSRENTEDAQESASGGYAPLGYYLNEATIVGMDEQGQALYRIWAGSAEEVPEEARLILREVTVEYQAADDVPWRLTAQSGEAPIHESYLDLSGEVELSTNGDQINPTVIRTEQLRFQPEEFLAETDAAVEVFIGGKRLDAVGMRADLKADHLALESSVHGQFRP